MYNRKIWRKRTLTNGSKDLPFKRKISLINRRNDTLREMRKNQSADAFEVFLLRRGTAHTEAQNQFSKAESAKARSVGKRVLTLFFAE
jgi:hypothetical protein